MFAVVADPVELGQPHALDSGRRDGHPKKIRVVAFAGGVVEVEGQGPFQRHGCRSRRGGYRLGGRQVEDGHDAGRTVRGVADDVDGGGAGDMKDVLRHIGRSWAVWRSGQGFVDAERGQRVGGQFHELGQQLGRLAAQLQGLERADDAADPGALVGHPVHRAFLVAFGVPDAVVGLENVAGFVGPRNAAVVQGDQLPVVAEHRGAGGAFGGVGFVVQEPLVENVQQAVMGGGVLARATLGVLDDVHRAAAQGLAGGFDQADAAVVRQCFAAGALRRDGHQAEVQRLVGEVELVRQQVEVAAFVDPALQPFVEKVGGAVHRVHIPGKHMLVGQQQVGGHQETSGEALDHRSWLWGVDQARHRPCRLAGGFAGGVEGRVPGADPSLQPGPDQHGAGILAGDPLGQLLRRVAGAGAQLADARQRFAAGNGLPVPAFQGFGHVASAGSGNGIWRLAHEHLLADRGFLSGWCFERRQQVSRQTAGVMPARRSRGSRYRVKGGSGGLAGDTGGQAHKAVKGAVGKQPAQEDQRLGPEPDGIAGLRSAGADSPGDGIGDDLRR